MTLALGQRFGVRVAQRSAVSDTAGHSFHAETICRILLVRRVFGAIPPVSDIYANSDPSLEAP